MNYDEFEATMLDAGWSLDQIEAQWQAYDPDCASGTAIDTWETEDWDRD